jgi:hypothetical protein
MSNEKESIAGKMLLLLDVDLDLPKAQKVAEFSEYEGLVFVTGYENGIRVEDKVEVILANESEYTGLMFGSKTDYLNLWNFRFDLDGMSRLMECCDMTIEFNPN